MKRLLHLHIPVVRLILAVIAAELVPLIILVAIVGAFGPSEPDLAAAQQFAARMGRWVGPIGGAICAYLAAYGIGRIAPERALSDGIIVGLCLAALDVIILVASNAPFEWLYVWSNVGKLAAATLGGFVSRGQPKTDSPAPGA
jgi:hypothetical protein